ncbi:MAG: VWA domain-containing protein [Acidobacteriaceae bacterium]|nr:VWA domain-containing protein [Acidobacteriaceae bacterium]MBV9778714.1 VWA domain-containing protein [Acidobacteriaceae bacterium]
MHRRSNKFSVLLFTKKTALAGLFASLFAVSLLAQFRADTRLVVLHASVTDRKGKLLTNLNQNAFKIFENGQLQQVKIFRREDVPVSLGIIIDDSGSMSTKRARVEAAAVALVRASNPQDEVFIVNFNDDAYLDVPFTNDIHRMEQGLARIDSRGGTAMRDAINMSLDYIRAEAKKDKKVLMVITDGNDNASNVSLEKVVARSNQGDTLVYAIGLFTDEERREAAKARRALNELTSATGGLAFYPKDVNEVQSLAVEIAHDIRNQYTIAYSPNIQALDGSYRQIKVTVDAPGKPVVRTRSGYYATPDSENAKRAAALPVTNASASPNP